jgi:cysteine desulfurase
VEREIKIDLQSHSIQTKIACITLSWCRTFLFCISLTKLNHIIHSKRILNDQFKYILQYRRKLTMQQSYPIYLDHNATTPLDPAVLETMIPYFLDKFGNAGSHTHLFGWEAAEAVDIARHQIAQLIGAKPHEIIFTSGATESVNLGIKGLFAQDDWQNRHIITTQTEHQAVKDTCAYLTQCGTEVTYLPVLANGSVDLNVLEAAIQPNTVLIAIMHGNNETGVIQPIRHIASIAHQYDLLFFTDATQSVGKMEIDVHADGIDLLALSGHKMNGPKGIGALFIRSGNPKLHLHAQIHGGGQETTLRSGTLNVPGIVGLGKACEISNKSLKIAYNQLKSLRDDLEKQLQTELQIKINGLESPRLPHTSNITFEHIDGERFLMEISAHVAISRSSACASMEFKPSFVLQAMGLTDEAIFNTFRFSVGRFTTQEEIDSTVKAISTAAKNHYRERDYIHY